MASSAVSGCLADELYSKGYHLYGAFLHPLAIARALNNLAIDLATGRASEPMLVKLGDALFPSPFVSSSVENLEGEINVPFDRINLVYSLPRFDAIERVGDPVKLIELRSSAGERILLRSNLMKKY